MGRTTRKPDWQYWSIVVTIALAAIAGGWAIFTYAFPPDNPAAGQIESKRLPSTETINVSGIGSAVIVNSSVGNVTIDN